MIMHQKGDNCIQNFHLWRYIIGYTFGNHILRLRLRVAVKLNFRPYIRRYTVLPAKSDSDAMFCLLIYQGLKIDRTLVY